MRTTVKWKFGATLGVLCLAAFLIALEFLMMEEKALVEPVAGSNSLTASAPPVPPPAKPAQPDIAAYWLQQALKAEKAGQAEIAANYRERLSAFEAGVPATLPTAPAGTSIVPLSTNMELYLRSAATPATRKPAKHEPASGVYLGMLGADQRVGYDVNKVQSVYGRKHAMYLAYVGWRKVQTDANTYFPTRTAERVQALDGALQIGWEPRYGLDDVKDDEYVRRFAKEAKASGIPIFLRYASEMNGSWVPWFDTPEKYIEKFRLIHHIMAEEAPNVAMVWSPNFWPPDTIDSYYPGDAYVDWVGFSLYTSPFLNGQEHLQGTMIDTFAPLYAKYSHKPIMIAEGAIAHTSLHSNKSYYAWAEDQLSYWYGLMPRLFPQLKGFTYFNFSRAQAQRTNGEYVYDLGENPYMDGLYQRLIQSDWYLPKVEPGLNPVPYVYNPFTSRSLPAGKQTVLVYPKLENARGEKPFAVALYQGKQRLGVSYEAPWEMEIQVDAASANEPWYTVAYNIKQEVIAISTANSPK